MKTINKILTIILVSISVATTAIFTTTSKIKMQAKSYTYNQNQKTTKLQSNLTKLSANTSKLARIKNDCNLMRSSDISNSSIQNIFFILPATYFVIVLSQSEGIAMVKYNDITGFCDNKNLESIDWSPLMPHFFSKGIIKDDCSTYIKKLPIVSSQNKATIEPEQEIFFLGKTTGDVPSDGTSNIWYYCNWQAGSTSLHTGYIYSERITLNTAFTPNTEQKIEDVPLPATSTNIETETTTENTPTLSSGLKILIVCIFLFPTIAVFILLVKKPKELNNNSTNDTNDNDDELPASTYSALKTFFETSAENDIKSAQKTKNNTNLSKSSAQKNLNIVNLGTKNVRQMDEIAPKKAINSEKNIKNINQKQPQNYQNNLNNNENSIKNTQKTPLFDKNGTHIDKNETSKEPKKKRKFSFFNKLVSEIEPTFPEDDEPL